MIALQKSGQPFHAVRFDGTIYDCGTKIGFLLANIAYAMEREDLGPTLKAEIAKLIGALVAQAHAELDFLAGPVAVEARRVECRVLVAAEQHRIRGLRKYSSPIAPVNCFSSDVGADEVAREVAKAGAADEARREVVAKLGAIQALEARRPIGRRRLGDVG